MLSVSMTTTNTTEQITTKCQQAPLTKKCNTIDALITYTAYNVKTLIECSQTRIYYQQRLLPSIHTFVKHTVQHCRITPIILVIALIYLGRLKNNLPERSRGEFDTPYKLFIAAVILASKFIEDSNRISQAVYKFIAPLYDFKIVNEMERSFLGVVKYNLFINLDEVDNFMMDHKNILDLELKTI